MLSAGCWRRETLDRCGANTNCSSAAQWYGQGVGDRGPSKSQSTRDARNRCLCDAISSLHCRGQGRGCAIWEPRACGEVWTVVFSHLARIWSGPNNINACLLMERPVAVSVPPQYRSSSRLDKTMAVPKYCTEQIMAGAALKKALIHLGQ